MLETGEEARMGACGKRQYKTWASCFTCMKLLLVSSLWVMVGQPAIRRTRTQSFVNTLLCQFLAERGVTEKKKCHHATANLAQWWLEGRWAMVLSVGLVLKWDYRLVWKKEEKGGLDVQASKRAEIFKCRQTRDHFIIISGGEARRGRRLLRGMETVWWDVISAYEWRLKIERFTRVCVSVCKSITGAV